MTKKTTAVKSSRATAKRVKPSAKRATRKAQRKNVKDWNKAFKSVKKGTATKYQKKRVAEKKAAGHTKGSWRRKLRKSDKNRRQVKKYGRKR